jgi:hypothetical protein
MCCRVCFAAYLVALLLLLLVAAAAIVAIVDVVLAVSFAISKFKRCRFCFVPKLLVRWHLLE